MRYTHVVLVYHILGVLALLLFFWLTARHANQVFYLSVRGGRGLLIRGRIPVGLQRELLDVLREAGVRDAAVWALREGGCARLLASGAGVDEHVLQRLRNVLGTRAWRDLRLCSPPTHRNLGQRLGWAWLAWRLYNRRHGNLKAL